MYEDGDVIISQFSKESGLLKTCEQIRKETRDMWIKANSFLVKVYHSDFSVHLSWAKIMKRCNPNGSVRVQFAGEKDPLKLIKWLRECHKSDLYHFAGMVLPLQDELVRKYQGEIAALPVKAFSLIEGARGRGIDCRVDHLAMEIFGRKS